jgi:hypothetical protein
LSRTPATRLPFDALEVVEFREGGERRDDGDHTHIIMEWP